MPDADQPERTYVTDYCGRDGVPITVTVRGELDPSLLRRWARWEKARAKLGDVEYGRRVSSRDHNQRRRESA